MLSFIAYYQNKYLSKHVSRKKFKESRQKKKLVMATIVLSLGIIYRGFINFLKPLVDKNGQGFNPIEDLET